MTFEPLDVLVGCEFTGVVRDAFIARGHRAVSCDLLDTEVPGPHYKGDVRDILNDGWDLAIFHPPCTYCTAAAEWAYGDGPYHQNVGPGTLVGAARREARREAIEFAKTLYNAPKVKRKVLENPVGILSSHLGPATQIIQPWMFGHAESKATCLWIKGRGLLRLRATNIVTPPRRLDDGPPDLFGDGGTARWDNQTDSGQNKLSPSDDRWADRSRTYPGIAEAFAIQFGGQCGQQ